VDILQRDDHALIGRDIDASNTSHVCSPSFNTVTITARAV
jgi:hypothetical protein